MCFVRSALVQKAFLQFFIVHSYGRSPVCVRMCSSSFLTLLPQTEHVPTPRIFPWVLRRCMPSPCACVKAFPQPGQVHSCGFAGSAGTDEEASHGRHTLPTTVGASCAMGTPVTTSGSGAERFMVSGSMDLGEVPSLAPHVRAISSQEQPTVRTSLEYPLYDVRAHRAQADRPLRGHGRRHRRVAARRRGPRGGQQVVQPALHISGTSRPAP